MPPSFFKSNLKQIYGLDLPELIKSDYVRRAEEYISIYFQVHTTELHALLIRNIRDYEVKYLEYYKSILPTDKELAEFTFWRDASLIERRYRHGGESKSIEEMLYIAYQIMIGLAISMDKTYNSGVFPSRIGENTQVPRINYGLTKGQRKRIEERYG